MNVSKRKAFNFFLSYYETGNELNDKDRLQFYDAILKKQFENIEVELTGMAKFAYISQKHSIYSQIKGYFDKTKDPMFDPTVGGMQGGTVAPAIQEKEKGQVQEKVKDIFSFRSALLLYGFNENLVDEWLRVRKAKKAVNTETAFKGFITEIRKSNLPINKILEICVSSSWSGFKIEYLQNKNLNNGNKQQTADERLQEAKSRILGEDSEFSESKPNNEDIEFTSFTNVGNF